MIDYELARVPPGHPDVSYLSDHRPLRLDMARPRPNSTPHGALLANFPLPPAMALFVGSCWERYGTTETPSGSDSTVRRSDCRDPCWKIGDFEQDAVRDLDQWIPDLVPYFEGIEFKVVELDDIGHDDIGRETLRPRDQLETWDRFGITKSDDDRTVRGSIFVDVDDGTYAVQVSVTTWDEQF
jgi:hypothetical protein